MERASVFSTSPVCRLPLPPPSRDRNYVILGNRRLHTLKLYARENPLGEHMISLTVLFFLPALCFLLGSQINALRGRGRLIDYMSELLAIFMGMMRMLKRNA